MREPATAIDQLPGAEFVIVGLEDLAAGRHTAAASLVMIASERLRELGFSVPTPTAGGDCAELQLYRLLCADPGEEDPYRTYNAMVRRLDRFLRASSARTSNVLQAG